MEPSDSTGSDGNLSSDPESGPSVPFHSTPRIPLDEARLFLDNNTEENHEFGLDQEDHEFGQEQEDREFGLGHGNLLTAGDLTGK